MSIHQELLAFPLHRSNGIRVMLSMVSVFQDDSLLVVEKVETLQRSIVFARLVIRDRIQVQTLNYLIEGHGDYPIDRSLHRKLIFVLRFYTKIYVSRLI
jgi:hypothetical protein